MLKTSRNRVEKESRNVDDVFSSRRAVEYPNFVKASEGYVAEGKVEEVKREEEGERESLEWEEVEEHVVESDEEEVGRRFRELKREVAEGIDLRKVVAKSRKKKKEGKGLGVKLVLRKKEVRKAAEVKKATEVGTEADEKEKSAAKENEKEEVKGEMPIVGYSSSEESSGG